MGKSTHTNRCTTERSRQFFITQFKKELMNIITIRKQPLLSRFFIRLDAFFYSKWSNMSSIDTGTCLRIGYSHTATK